LLEDTMHTLNLRSFLWFATGVALTVTSIATFGAWRANAAVTPGESTFVPVAPCRLFDTRPDQNVADSNTTPIGQTATRTQQVTGQVGNCNIPAGISGVAMNVTIVNPTADSFLVLFPADETTLPVGSNLNWTAGQSPTPNKVDVKLSPGGQVKIFNNTGTVDVLADIVGYYTTTTITQLTADITALQTAVAQISDNGGTPSTGIADNAADIAALETAVTQLRGNDTANDATNTAQDAAIADNADDNTAQDLTITALETAVAQLTAAGTAQDTAIAQNTDDLLDTNMDVTSLLEDTNVIPSGVTVTGVDVIDGIISDDIDPDAFIVGAVQLPGSAIPLAGVDILIAPRDEFPATETSPECGGTVAAPTAPAGKVCVYTSDLLNIRVADGRPLPALGESGFGVAAFPDGAIGERSAMSFTWAYTAP